MLKDIKKHPVHYLTLLIILTFGGFCFFYSRHSSQAQILSAFLTTIFYVLWGVIHHYIEGDLHARIVTEYLAVALLGFVILFFLVNRV